MGPRNPPYMGKFILQLQGEHPGGGLGWGTAMNTGRKASLFIPDITAQRLLDAAAYSYCIRTPLNCWFTVHYRAAGVHERVHEFREALLSYISDWLRYHTGRSAADVWVLENPPFSDEGGRSSGGLNLHVVVHVPRHMHAAFKKKLKDWVKQAGGRCRGRALRFAELDHVAADIGFFLEQGLLGVLRYCLKGSSPRFRLQANIPAHHPANQGTVVGKRCGYSESLSPTRWRTDEFLRRTPIGHRRRIIRDCWDGEDLLEVPRFFADVTPPGPVQQAQGGIVQEAAVW